MFRQFARLAVVAAVGCAGCSDSEKAVPVSGKVVKGGAAFNPAADAGKTAPAGEKPYRVFFRKLSDPRKGEEYSADVDYASGTFTVAGVTPKGIPPGKYHVSVVVGNLSGPGASIAAREKKAAATPAAPGSNSSLGKAPGKSDEGPASNYTGQAFEADVDVPEGGLKDYVIEMK